MTKEKILEFIKWTENMAYVEYWDCNFQINNEELFWKLEDDEWVYSSERLHNDVLYKHGFVIINADTGCGETCTYIFEGDKEIN